jgi:hypothetical protein
MLLFNSIALPSAQVVASERSLSTASGQLFRDLSSGLDEELAQRADRPLLQAKNGKRASCRCKLDRQHLQRRPRYGEYQSDARAAPIKAAAPGAP